MRERASSAGFRLRVATLVFSVLVLLACTSFCTHIDKAGGDDGKGHCSICLSATAHVSVPAASIHLAPQLLSTDLSPRHDPPAKSDRFDSSLYIRPPPLS
jgi:hypothetical protein